ncbi:MAG: DMT family transporter, partial [Acidimicrobiales bacterium]
MVVAFALGSALLYALASVFQQRAAEVAPGERSLRPGLLLHLAARPLWLAGVAADVAAYGLQFLALHRGSLVVVQLLLISGLLFALPIGAAIARPRRRLGRSEWLAALAVVGGLCLFLGVAAPAAGRSETSGTAWALILTATLGGALLLAVLGGRGPAGLPGAPDSGEPHAQGDPAAGAEQDTRAQQGARRAAMLAAAAGVLYGLTAALTKATSHLLSGGLLHAAGRWEPWALIACGVLGMILAQSAFQAGPLAASLPMLTIVDPLVSVAI